VSGCFFPEHTVYNKKYNTLC